MELTLFVSKVTRDEKNCSYPYKVVVNNPDELKDAVRFDHVCAEYRNGYRRNSNFVVSDCAVMGCDNDASDDSEDWITPEALIEELDDVPFAVTFSRHHMKSKNGKTPRPKFHVYFKISEIRDPDAYKALKERIQQEYPFFDDNALDAGRFIYGSKSDDAVWHEGNTTIDVFIAKRAQQTTHVIPAGKRNATLSRFAGRVVKRYGHGDEARAIFLEEAEKCDPPLPDEELDKIWASAGKFEKVVSSQPGYVPPEQYNPALPKGPAGSLKPMDYFDIGEAKVLTREYGDELRFNPATDYLRYNGVNWEESKEAATGATEVISREDYERVQNLIDQRCADKKVDVGSEKYNTRYPFTHKLQCGECGSYLKHKYINGRVSGRYEAWACSGHILDKNSCSLKAVPQECIEAAFTTMLNKLIFSKKKLLGPFLKTVKNIDAGGISDRLAKIEEELDQNAKKDATISNLAASGVLDAGTFMNAQAEINAKRLELNTEKSMLTMRLTEGYKSNAEAIRLVQLIDHLTISTEFNKEAFESMVETAIVHSRTDISFKLKCGLEFHEEVKLK